ncbi:MAG: type II toxin-antitoxin system VapC family toxin [Dehalococcoidia bacterium]
MTYLVDSDSIIDAIIGISAALSELERNAAHGLAVSIITYGEVYDGAFGFPAPAGHIESFRRFLHGYTVLGLADNEMEQFAQLRSTLRRQGNIIPDFDILVAEGDAVLQGAPAPSLLPVPLGCVNAHSNRLRPHPP